MSVAQAAQAYDETLDRSSLHYAASRGQLLVLHALLTRGDRVNTLTIDGVSPLHDACSTGHVYCARILIKAGARVNPQEYHEGRTPLFEACMHGHTSCVKLLLESGAQTNPQHSLSSPLHDAAMYGNCECVTMLLDAGANIDALESIQGMPLHTACENNQYKCAKLLLLKGANPCANVRHKTPLHCTALTDNAQLVELLVVFGADVFYRDAKNLRASELARPNSDSHKILKYYEDNPLPLLQQCRLQIKALLSGGVSYHLRNAIQDLPKPLQSYLNYDDLR